MNNFISDGAPIKNNLSSKKSYTSKITNYAEKIKYVEGMRGFTTRTTLVLRYVSYFLLVIIASAFTQALTNDISYADGGGFYMLLSSTTISFTGAIATLFYANLRNEIIHKVRHYIFGIVILPGTLLAGFLNITKNFWGDDTLSSTLSLAIPVIFLVTVVLPSFIFVKEMTGLRSLYKSNLDDQEAVTLWTRQDGLQR